MQEAGKSSVLLMFGAGGGCSALEPQESRPSGGLHRRLFTLRRQVRERIAVEQLLQVGEGVRSAVAVRGTCGQRRCSNWRGLRRPR